MQLIFQGLRAHWIIDTNTAHTKKRLIAGIKSSGEAFLRP